MSSDLSILAGTCPPMGIGQAKHQAGFAPATRRLRFIEIFKLIPDIKNETSCHAGLYC